ncbi:MAG: helix-turn-helix domain-containing protein [Fusobacterium necrophorum]|nr:helix-turn-helix domain-containing protein [Fusobacterium necrophorum]
MEIRILLKKLRESRNLTIKELSEKAKVGNGTIGDIESGRNTPRKTTLEKLAKALNLNSDERVELFATLVPLDVSKKIISSKNYKYVEGNSIRFEKKFPTFLKSFMSEKNYDITFLCKKIKISEILLNNYLSGIETPNNDFVDNFIKVFKISHIEAEHIKAYIDYDNNFKDPLAISNVDFELSYELMEIPVYSSVSAGYGYSPESLPIKYVSIPKIDGNIIGIRVSGDSMEKTIYDGDIVIVKKDIEVNVGDIGVFLLNKEFGDGVVKRLAKKNGVFVLESDNAYYKPIEIKSSEIMTCGKVIKIIRTSTNKQKDPFVELFNSLSADKQQDLLNYAEFLKNKK